MSFALKNLYNALFLIVLDFSKKTKPTHQPFKYSEYTMRSALSIFIPISFGFLIGHQWINWIIVHVY